MHPARFPDAAADHGHAVLIGADGSQSDAAGLGGQHHGDLADVKITSELVRQFLHEGGVHPMVQKPVYLDDVAGQDTALPTDALFQCFHDLHSFIISRWYSTILTLFCPISGGKTIGRKTKLFLVFLPVFVSSPSSEAHLNAGISCPLRSRQTAGPPGSEARPAGRTDPRCGAGSRSP